MIYDVIILGSGVAGLTAGLYLGRANKKVMIIESGVLGGTVSSLETIDNYPGMPHTSGERLINGLVSQVTELSANIDFMSITSIDFDKKCIYSGDKSFFYKSLIVATGTSYKQLNLPNVERYKFKGVSYCAVCDGRLYKDKEVVVVTDGMMGKSSIDYLKNIVGSLTIVDISGGYSDTSDDVKVYSQASVLEVFGDNYLSGIRINISGKSIDIRCDGLFVCLGKSTDISLFENDLKCAEGHICADENMHTNIEGVFVAGDVRVKSLRQIVTAISDGAIAGSEAIKYLETLR